MCVFILASAMLLVSIEWITKLQEGSTGTNTHIHTHTHTQMCTLTHTHTHTHTDTLAHEHTPVCKIEIL